MSSRKDKRYRDQTSFQLLALLAFQALKESSQFIFVLTCFLEQNKTKWKTPKVAFKRQCSEEWKAT